MQPTSDELEMLIAHEARYFEIWSQVTRTGQVWFLDSADLPDYHSANRALRLRYVDEAQQKRGTEPVVAEIIGHYRERGLPVVVDVDPTAEALGFGRALRMRGVMPVIGSMLLMRFGGNSLLPPSAKSADSSCVISLVPRAAHSLHPAGTSPACSDNLSSLPNFGNNEAGPSVNTKETVTAEMRAWIDLAGCDEDSEEDAAFWRRVAGREAYSPDCRLYLAHVDDQPVGACQLFSHAGWGLIDSVITHPQFRRRGIASQLVAQTVQDSQRLGNFLTYLYTERASAGERVYRRLGFEVWGIDTLRRHILF